MTPQDASAAARKICALAPIVPVLVVDDPAHARPLAEALVAGGLPALEVTLRTPAALEVIAEMAQVAGGTVGAGAVTSSEAMRLFERGYDVLKFFPAEAAGGAPALKGIGSPLPQISFCPTGGVNIDNATSYLSLPNVLCAGGSWVAPKALMQAGDWEGITDLARAASQLAR
jgi:2-dehydro-3-deoxyphosphogluconate aldolase/(4S)-4-hydroxy-2-oxoglutarate aldolase